MLHSIAGQIEYTNGLNRSLQDLVQYAIEEQAKKSQIRAEREQDDETDTVTGSVEFVVSMPALFHTAEYVQYFMLAHKNGCGN